MTVAFVIIPAFAATAALITFIKWYRFNASAPEHCVPQNIPPWEDLNEPTYVRREWERLGGTEKGWTVSDYYSLKAHMQKA